MKNEELKHLYVSYLPELQKIYQDLDSKDIKDYAGPLLISCFEENYIKSKHRLMIFGQETNGWHDEYLKSAEDIEDSMNVYHNFKLGTDYNSLFWQYAHEINKTINGVDDLNFVWNNVNKFGGQEQPGRPCCEVLANENAHFNVLSKELEILEPDVCIFISGPSYDNDLKNKLADLQIERFGEYPANEVARYVSKALPVNSFRTYHPGYGNRYQEWYYEVIANIAKSIR